MDWSRKKVILSEFNQMQNDKYGIYIIANMWILAIMTISKLQSIEPQEFGIEQGTVGYI